MKYVRAMGVPNDCECVILAQARYQPVGICLYNNQMMFNFIK